MTSTAISTPAFAHHLRWVFGIGVGSGRPLASGVGDREYAMTSPYLNLEKRKRSDVALGRLMAAIEDAIAKVDHGKAHLEPPSFLDQFRAEGFNKIARKLAYDAARIAEETRNELPTDTQCEICGTISTCTRPQASASAKVASSVSRLCRARSATSSDIPSKGGHAHRSRHSRARIFSRSACARMLAMAGAIICGAGGHDEAVPQN